MPVCAYIGIYVHTYTHTNKHTHFFRSTVKEKRYGGWEFIFCFSPFLNIGSDLQNFFINTSQTNHFCAEFILSDYIIFFKIKILSLFFFLTLFIHIYLYKIVVLTLNISVILFLFSTLFRSTINYKLI